MKNRSKKTERTKGKLKATEFEMLKKHKKFLEHEKDGKY